MSILNDIDWSPFIVRHCKEVIIPENSLRIRSNRSGLSHALTLLSVRVPKVHYFHPALLINRAYILPISPSPNVSVILYIQGRSTNDADFDI